MDTCPPISNILPDRYSSMIFRSSSIRISFWSRRLFSLSIRRSFSFRRSLKLLIWTSFSFRRFLNLSTWTSFSFRRSFSFPICASLSSMRSMKRLLVSWSWFSSSVVASTCARSCAASLPCASSRWRRSCRRSLCSSFSVIMLFRPRLPFRKYLITVMKCRITAIMG